MNRNFLCYYFLGCRGQAAPPNSCHRQQTKKWRRKTKDTRRQTEKAKSDYKKIFCSVTFLCACPSVTNYIIITCRYWLGRLSPVWIWLWLDSNRLDSARNVRLATLYVFICISFLDFIFGERVLFFLFGQWVRSGKRPYLSYEKCHPKCNLYMNGKLFRLLLCLSFSQRKCRLEWWGHKKNFHWPG